MGSPRHEHCIMYFMRGVGLKIVRLFILGFVFLMSLAALADEAPLLSFKEWQGGRIKDAQAALTRIQIERADAIARDNRKVTSADVQQAKINLDIAKELTANDYFVLYLAPKLESDKTLLDKAIQSMDKNEIAAILAAYQNTLEERKKSISGPEGSVAISKPNQTNFLSGELFRDSKEPQN